jgi:ATP adenylyltransferase
MALYNLDNSRTAEQLARMQQLERSEVCLFCPEHLGSEQQVEYSTQWWSVTGNRYPYAGTKLHLLLVPRQHVRDMIDLDQLAQADFWQVLRWVRENYGLTFYGFGVRNGPFQYTGSTVEHLHAHVMVGDVENPEHTPVRFKFSSRPDGLDVHGQ